MAGIPRPWRRRALTVIVFAAWTALAIGIVGSMLEDITEVTLAAIAAGLGAAWGLATTATPLPQLDRPLVLDALTLGGVVLTMTAVAMTGGAGSPYLLLSVTPAIYAALLGGFRPGLAAAILSSALLVAMALAREDPLVTSLVIAALYPVLAATVAQIRRIVLDLEERAETAEATSVSTNVRLEQLEHANALLADLADVTDGTDLNPIDIGRAGLETLTKRYPDSAAVAMVNGKSGPIVVARHGNPISGGHQSVIPLELRGRQVGAVRLTTVEALDDSALASLAAGLRPLALAFGNALLLQDIAQNAVKEERTRLARELHDEIGPSLASLGLSLDVAMINSADQRELGEHLEQLRDRVTGLVDEVRSTVSDLRSTSLGSLATYVETLPLETGTDIPLDVDLDERRPARPSLAQEIHRIVGESVRNAFAHSSATSIAVRGWVDFDRGRIVIEDDGVGFDPTSPPTGHFGVIGMQERAKENGMRLGITSNDTGTKVQLEWGNS